MIQTRQPISVTTALRTRMRRGPAFDMLSSVRQTEQQITLVRWIGIVIAAIAAPFFLHGGQLTALLATCAAASAYNLVFEVYIIPRRPTWLLRGYVTTLGDIALADVGIALTGGANSELYPAYFLIAVLASIRFGGKAALLAMAAIMASYAIIVGTTGPLMVSGGEVAIRLGFVAATSVFAGFIAGRARAAEAAVQAAYDATLAALSAALDERDSETRGHSQRVATYAAALGTALGLDDPTLAALRRGALLHDIGKIGVPDAILRKKTGLTEEEREVVRNHPTSGARILADIPFLADALPVVLHHHERYDGTGYPDGQRGQDIALVARIFTVVDAYDAMTSDRPYRKGMPHEAAIAELRRHAGAQFDADIVEAFAALAPST